MSIQNTILIGSGNMATRLGSELKSKGCPILQVYSPNSVHAGELSNQLDSEPVNDLNALQTSADLYIIAVKDDAIATVAENMPHVKGIVVHTSGSVGINVLNRFENHGSFYPLQTVSKNKAVNFSNIPVCIEGNSSDVLKELKELAHSISNNIHEINSIQRKTLHLAAVFACNFSNHMYTIAHDLLQENNVDFKLLLPLIAETAQKIMTSSPDTHQTGPAVRDDVATMQAHEALLAENEDYQKIYKLLSKSIAARHNEEEL